MIRLTGTVRGEDQVDRVLSRLVALTSDLSPVFVELGKEFRLIETEQFENEGYGWTPLSPAYGKWKSLRYPDKTILRRTDALFSAMTQEGAEGNVSDIQPMSAQFGASGETAFYGQFHQLGTTKMPQRKVVDLREEDKRRLTKTFQIYFIRLGSESAFLA